MTFFKTLTVEVDVDVTDDDFSDDDLIELCEARGIWISPAADDDIMEMFYAFKLGKTDHAMDVAKRIAQDRTGLIL